MWLPLLVSLLLAEGAARLTRRLWRAARAVPVSLPRTTPPGRTILLFDGECRFCTSQAQNVLRWAPPGTVETQNFQAPGVLEAVPGITHAACMRAMHLVLADGRVYEGFEAVAHAVALRPGLGTLALAYYLPGVRMLCDLGYALVAANRYRLFGKQIAKGECDEACAAHFRP